MFNSFIRGRSPSPISFPCVSCFSFFCNVMFARSFNVSSDVCGFKNVVPFVFQIRWGLLPVTSWCNDTLCRLKLKLPQVVDFGDMMEGSVRKRSSDVDGMYGHASTIRSLFVHAS